MAKRNIISSRKEMIAPTHHDFGALRLNGISVMVRLTDS
jgi:hypothetical protein